MNLGGVKELRIYSFLPEAFCSNGFAIRWLALVDL